MPSNGDPDFTNYNAVIPTQADLEYAYWLDPPDNGLYPSVPNASALPITPVEGQCVWQADTNEIKVWSGVAWVVVLNNGTVAALGANSTVPTPASGDNSTKISTTAFAAERALVGNLLTANQASVETDLTGWTANSADITIQRDVAAAMHGVASIRVTSATSATMTKRVRVSDRTRFPVLPGETYTMRARIDATGGATAFVAILWYTSGGALISNPSGTQVAAGTTGVSELTFVAPATAAYAELNLYLLSTSASGTYANFDCLGFWAGAGGEWAMPGTPIVNLGTKVSHPNTDDVLVQSWDSGLNRWQTAHYDSGLRDISSLLINGWAVATTDGRFRIRRVGNMVTLTAHLSAAAKTADALATLPTGFRPQHNHYWLAGSATGNVLGGMYAPATGSSAGYGFTGNAYSQQTWATNDPIPTSLPGTLVSAAPA